MPILSAEKGELYYEIIDLTPSWITEPETIIFHHGLGATADVWTGWLPALIDRYRIVRFDMRGLSRSPLPPKDYAWSLDGLADDVFTVAAATQSERFHLIGESIGGTIGLCCATRPGGKVLSVGVSNGAHVGGSIQNVEAWHQIMEQSGMEGWSEHMMPYRFFDDRPSGAMRAWYEKAQAENNPEAILSGLGVLVGTDLTPRFDSIKVPILIMHPDSSPFIPVALVVEMHNQLPGSELQIFAHAKHGLPFSHAAECASVYRDFLERRTC